MTKANTRESWGESRRQKKTRLHWKTRKKFTVEKRSRKSSEEESKHAETSSENQEEEEKHVDKSLPQIEAKANEHIVKWTWNMKHYQVNGRVEGKRGYQAKKDGLFIACTFLTEALTKDTAICDDLWRGRNLI